MSATTESGYKWIGKNVPRQEDRMLLAGRATYVGDVVLPGMLHAATLRSPHAHAKIVSIDTSKAKALPGVHAVLTGAEMEQYVGPMPAFCAEPVPQWAVAVEKVRYPGEAVAVVAAESRYIAEDACALIDVKYEQLPVLIDMEEAMKPGATLVHDTLESNVVYHRSIDWGDVEGDFARADRVVRHRARWNRMGASPIETAGAVCSWDPYTQSMDVWSNTNFYNFLPWVYAGIFKVSTAKLKLIPCAVGGSFGSKHFINKVFSVAGALSKATGKPVRFLEDRVENISSNDNVGPDRIYEGELALSADGEFLSLRLHLIDDYGAYFQFGPGQNGNGLAQQTGPYRIGSLGMDMSFVLTNKVQQGFFRGAGADPSVHILELLVEQAAVELGVDSIELRRKNFIRPDEFPYKMPVGNIYDSGDYEKVMDRALELVDLDHWRKEQKRLREEEGRYIGIGWVSAQERTTYNATEWWFLYDKPPLPANSTPESVKVDIDAFGGVRVELGCPHWGNSPASVTTKVVAEELGIDPSDIAVIYSDSSSGALSAGPGGSRLTVMLSGAARGAARQVKEKMIRIAASMLEASPDDVEMTDGTFNVKGSPDKSVSIGDVAFRAHLFVQDMPEGESSGLIAVHTYDHPFTSKPKGPHDAGAFYPIMAHAVHVPIVEVDPETGIVKVLKYYAVNDCGTVMNPKLVEGQIMGGISQGIGAALMEQYRYDAETGELASGTWREYLLPSFMEMPEFVIDHVETPSPFTEYGVKGGGEGGRLVSPTALNLAVNDALKPLGASLHEVPMTPERVVAAVKAAKG